MCGYSGLQLTTGDVWGQEEAEESLNHLPDGPEERRVLNPHNFCKPVPKREEDRQALLSVSGLASSHHPPPPIATVMCFFSACTFHLCYYSV